MGTQEGTLVSGPGVSQTSFGERYIVNVNAPLVEFDTPAGQAFVVKDQEQPGRSAYAFVHHQTVPPRSEVYRKLRVAGLGNIVTPLDQGIMYVELEGRAQRLVTIFERPTGGALLSATGQVNPRLNAAKLRQNVVLSALKGLAGLHKKGIIHRSIRPTNIYFVTPESDEICLGECYTNPPGYKQPPALEAIEFSFADEAARGEGTAASDFYQLGASLMCLSRGQALWLERDRNSLLMARINQGSFWALSGGQDIPGALGNLVRGLMADEPEERWGAPEILDWFEGHTKTKRVGLKTWALNRPVTFKGVAYVDRRLLADAFGRDPLEAARFMRAQDFNIWAANSLRDETVNDKVEQLLSIQGAAGRAQGNRMDEYKMVARVCMFLHPSGPIRFKGLALFLNGLPSLVAHAFASDDRDSLATIGDLLDPKLLATLAEIGGERAGKLSSLINDYRRFMAHAGNNQLGKGMERLLYELNKSLPCLAPRLKAFWVGSTKQMMSALDQISATGGGKNILLDRHIAAYLATHGHELDRDFNKLAAAQNDPARFSMVAADFFGNLQSGLGMPSLPHLTNSLVEGLAPALRALKNKKRREQVQGLLDKVKKEGDISKLTNQVNLTRVAAEDAREFGQARTALAKVERERAYLSRRILPSDPDALRRGYQAGRWIALFTVVVVSTVIFL